jgi:DNA repair protein RecO (recombination protein O)
MNSPGRRVQRSGQGDFTRGQKGRQRSVCIQVHYNEDMPSRERSFRTEGVVLRHSDWGEADRLLWLYSRELGKVRVIAKGVRKMRSRKAGHLEPFTRAILLLARGRDLLIVTQADTVEAYLPMRQDLLRLGYAAYVVELLDRFTYEEDENQALYRLLTETLSRLNSGLDAMLVLRYYEIRLLDLLGYRPQLFTCVKCEAAIQPVDQFFSFAEGGVLCPRCGARGPESLPVTVNELRFLRHFQRSTFKEAARARPTDVENRQLERLMQRYVTFILERNLNTPAFIQQVQEKPPTPNEA